MTCTQGVIIIGDGVVIPMEGSVKVVNQDPYSKGNKTKIIFDRLCQVN